MRSSVVTDDPSAVYREHDRQPLDCDVVHDLVESTLKEGGVHRDDRHDALRRKAGGEGHGVLLADADVEEAIGNSLKSPCRPVPPGIAAVIATARSSALRISRTESANTAVY